MTTTFVEEGCTIELGGRTFESGGAFVSDEYLIAYPAVNGVLTDWHGNAIGTWRSVSSWRVNSWQGTYMYAIRAKVDDRNYYGRGFGVGMVLRGKRVKSELAA